MGVLGSRLKLRRRQKRLHQNDVAGKNSASFLSKVETGAAKPSLKVLTDWANELETTVADLIGDQLLLEGAKAAVLNTDKCLDYLNALPQNKTTNFLRKLTISATSATTQVPLPPNTPELQYLTAKVLLQRNLYQQAKNLIKTTLETNNSPLLQLKLLSLLCQIHTELSEAEEKRAVELQLREILHNLNYKQLIDEFPSKDSLSFSDIELLKLADFAYKIKSYCSPNFLK